jgi:4-hydroxy-2-oxoheptanedioate aldolase
VAGPRAASELVEDDLRNVTKAALLEGRPVLGCVMMTPSPLILQALASGGFEFFFIDTEHAPIGIESISSMIAAAIAVGTPPMVRVQTPGSDLVKQVLDGGAYGIIFPLIEDKAAAEAVVRATRYPPLGNRSFGPFHAAQQWNGMAAYDYVKVANDELLVTVIIESRKAIANLDEILSVEGIDVFLIARGDLTMDCGCPGDLENPQVLELVAEAERKILARPGAILGGQPWTRENAKSMIERGYRFVMLGTDIGLLKIIARQTVDAAKS